MSGPHRWRGLYDAHVSPTVQEAGKPGWGRQQVLSGQVTSGLWKALFSWRSSRCAEQEAHLSPLPRPLIAPRGLHRQDLTASHWGAVRLPLLIRGAETFRPQPSVQPRREVGRYILGLTHLRGRVMRLKR